ncbi:MAG: glycosyltransferase family 2 protein [Puniceicoccaceae bacterium]
MKEEKETISSISVVIPIFNEEENIPLLREKLDTVLGALPYRWECILVNDGSSDRSAELIDAIVAEDSRYLAIQFRRNFGQTAAMQAGFDIARGDVIIPMDGDLQNDPADIGRMLDKIAEGYDVVSGWRKKRQDKKVRRVFVSRVANRIISKISGVPLHDYGCSLKAYRREVLKGVRLYGEMHRFIPIYASWQGARVAEIEVNHFPRIHGKSSYGLERVFKVVLDLLVVKFLHVYAAKPIYVFGGFGIFCGVSSMLFATWMFWLKFVEEVQLSGTPLPEIVVMLGGIGIISVLLGLMCELVTRTYFESQGKRTYLVRAAGKSVEASDEAWESLVTRGPLAAEEEPQPNLPPEK